MPQSLAQLHIHLVFSTKNRAPIIHDEIREPLHRYMAVVLKNHKCPATLINSVEDHVHILFELHRTVTLSSAVEAVKKTSSIWIKTQGPEFANFAWQSGYGAFAVSKSGPPAMLRYITNRTTKNSHSKTSSEQFSPSKGLNSTNGTSGIKSPRQGSDHVLYSQPMALPWALVGKPLRGEYPSSPMTAYLRREIINPDRLDEKSHPPRGTGSAMACAPG